METNVTPIERPVERLDLRTSEQWLADARGRRERADDETIGSWCRLFDALAPGQRICLHARDWFLAHGNEGGGYVISSNALVRLGRNGAASTFLCLHAFEGVDRADEALAMVLLLRTDERRFRWMANPEGDLSPGQLLALTYELSLYESMLGRCVSAMSSEPEAQAAEAMVEAVNDLIAAPRFADLAKWVTA